MSLLVSRCSSSFNTTAVLLSSNYKRRNFYGKLKILERFSMPKDLSLREDVATLLETDKGEVFILEPWRALFQVAYVLGQLQNKVASTALSEILRNVDEHPMVRHEAAEALGSIADNESIALLEEFVKDPERIVSQSCEVALGMLQFERSGRPFEYFFMETLQVQ